MQCLNTIKLSPEYMRADGTFSPGPILCVSPRAVLAVLGSGPIRARSVAGWTLIHACHCLAAPSNVNSDTGRTTAFFFNFLCVFLSYKKTFPSCIRMNDHKKTLCLTDWKPISLSGGLNVCPCPFKLKAKQSLAGKQRLILHFVFFLGGTLIRSQFHSD